MTTLVVREEEDLRLAVPLYTVTEAARYLDVSRSRLDTWVDGYVRRQPGSPSGARSRTPAAKWARLPDREIRGAPVITAFPRGRRGYPRLPFVGLAEGYVLNAFRQAGVPLQRIRPSLDWLTEHVGPHALASKDLYTDGAEVLWDWSQQEGTAEADSVVKQLIETRADTPQRAGKARAAPAYAYVDSVAKQLMVPRLSQYVFREVVQNYLKQISFGDGRYASRIRLPQYRHSEVVVDPRRGFGHPIFAASGVRVEDALGPVRAGERLEVVAEDYGVPPAELRDAYAVGA